MKKHSDRQGNNIIEYVITFLLVGFAAGYAIYAINPEVFRNYFKTTFSSTSNQQQNSIVVGPLTE